MRRFHAAAAPLLLAFAAPAIAQDAPFTGLVLNCWRDFPVQVNTLNQGPFRDTWNGTCPIREDWARVAEGETEGHAEGAFSGIPPGTCVDLVFLYVNDGEHGGTITLSVNGTEVGRVQGDGPRDSDRCETVVFRSVRVEGDPIVVRIAFEEKETVQIHHNGAVTLSILPAASESRTLAVSGEPRLGSAVSALIDGDPGCDPGRRYLLAAAPAAGAGRLYPDGSGRRFPLDGPLVVARGRLDSSGRALTSLRLPRDPDLAFRTIHFAFVSFEKFPGGDRLFTAPSNVVTVTLVP